MRRKARSKWEFGDFQTPPELAEAAVAALKRLIPVPATVIEPTCGKGAFITAAMKAFPATSRFVGLDINESHLTDLKHRLLASSGRVSIIQGDFFFTDWPALLGEAPQPFLILGNPPWVTSAELGLLRSANLPRKSNFQQRRGYDAITGKSNFDISEWMLLQYLDWLDKRPGVIAVLCKTSVARKVLRHAWRTGLPVSKARIFRIDAQRHFAASVDACFLIIDMLTSNAGATDCEIYDNIDSSRPTKSIGYHDGLMVSDADSYLEVRHLLGRDAAYIWRSGIKHDCARVMELEPEPNSGGYRNGMGDRVAIEDVFVYPMLKSSDVGNGSVRCGRKFMLVTQQYVNEDTSVIRLNAPETWRYLEQHEHFLSARASSIYRNRPRFPIFGVGSYSFSPWKVVISGLYKRLSFKIVGPYNGRPVVADDTVNFLPCWSREEAEFVQMLLSSAPARQFYESMIFWSEKRPVTIDILSRLDLRSLSADLGFKREYDKFSRRRNDYEHETTIGQLSFGIAEKATTADQWDIHKAEH